MVEPAGVHVVVELHGCSGAAMSDRAGLQALMRAGAEAAGATVVAYHDHPFQPGGLAAVALLAESHLSVHTWPEADYVAADIFTCGDSAPMRAVRVLADGFSAARVETLQVHRGRGGLEVDRAGDH